MGRFAAKFRALPAQTGEVRGKKFCVLPGSRADLEQRPELAQVPLQHRENRALVFLASLAEWQGVHVGLAKLVGAQAARSRRKTTRSLVDSSGLWR